MPEIDESVVGVKFSVFFRITTVFLIAISLSCHIPYGPSFTMRAFLHIIADHRTFISPETEA
jgi:hypothetical protein